MTDYNFSYNGAKEMAFGPTDGEEDGEHDEVDFVQIFKIFAMQDALFVGPELFDIVQGTPWILFISCEVLCKIVVSHCLVYASGPLESSSSLAHPGRATDRFDMIDLVDLADKHVSRPVSSSGCGERVCSGSDMASDMRLFSSALDIRLSPIPTRDVRRPAGTKHKYFG